MRKGTLLVSYNIITSLLVVVVGCYCWQLVVAVWQLAVGWLLLLLVVGCCWLLFNPL